MKNYIRTNYNLYLMPNELREFVYLDNMSVNSLLASQYVAIPETIRDLSESLEGEEVGGEVSGSVGVSDFFRVSGQISGTESAEERSMAEIERRVNDQYRFSILYKSLNQTDKLTDLTEETNGNLDFSQGDVIKVQGGCISDPFYRFLSGFSLIMRIFQSDQVAEQADQEELESIFSDCKREEDSAAYPPVKCS